MSGISSVGMFSTSVTGRSSAENSSKKPDARSMEMPTISPSSVGNNFIAVCMPSAAPFCEQLKYRQSFYVPAHDRERDHAADSRRAYARHNF